MELLVKVAPLFYFKLFMIIFIYRQLNNMTFKGYIYKITNMILKVILFALGVVCLKQPKNLKFQ